MRGDIMNINKQGIFQAETIKTNPNIFLNSDFHSTYAQTTGWDTSKNGTVLANNWFGYNSGVTNASTVYHAHLTTFDGGVVYVYIRETENWLATWQDIQSSISIGNTYTFTVEQYRTGNNYLNCGLYYYKNGASSAAFHLGYVNGSSFPINQWGKLAYTFTVPSDIDLSKTARWFMYGQDGGTGTIYMRRPKMEIGSVATPYTLHTSEGVVEGNHGFSEGNGIMRIYDTWAEAREFIEW